MNVCLEGCVINVLCGHTAAVRISTVEEVYTSVAVRVVVHTF